MSDELEQLVEKADSAIQSASDLKALDDLRVSFLGKKGEITQRMQTLGKLAPEERKEAGKLINNAKQAVQQAIEARKTALQAEELNARLAEEAIDVTCYA